MKDAAHPDQKSIPPAELWQSPLAWTGNPPAPVLNYSRPLPAQSIYVRGEMILTLSETIGPGMSRQTQYAAPALLCLDKGQLLQAHATGPDGQCWTYTRSKQGRKWMWALGVGMSFPATEGPAPATLQVDQAVIQSLLPLEGSNHSPGVIITADGREQNISRMADPDSDD